MQGRIIFMYSKSPALFFLLLVSLFAASRPVFGRAMERLERFESGGKSVRVETFYPGGDENKLPSLVILHGSTGVEFADRFIATMAEAIAQEGFVTHLVYYFDRTGTTLADDETMHRFASEWINTIDNAVAYIHRRRAGAKIGIFGYSLGGYLAAAESVGNTTVSAGVVLAGGLDEASAPVLRQAPPMLILHGEADKRVPVSEARKLAETLKEAGREPEVHLYPSEGHIMSLGSYFDVISRSAKFFHDHLQASS